MASVNTNTQLQLTKDVYGKLQRAVPNNSKLPRMLAKNVHTQVGTQFTFPVQLTAPHGALWTSAKGSTATVTPIAGESDTANIDPYEFYLTSDIANSVYRRSLGSGNAADGSKGDAKAFASAKMEVVTQLIESAMNYKEMFMLYGQDSIGQYDSDNNTNTSATVTSVVIDEGEWAPAMWFHMLGGTVDIYDASDDSVVNTTGEVTVTSVTASTRTVTFTAAAGDITAIDAIGENHYAVPAGWGSKASSNTSPGLKKILSNSGSLFGIDASTYVRWAATTTAVGGAFTFSKLSNGLVSVTTQGNLRGKLCLLASPAACADLQNSLDDQIRYYNDDKAKKVGSSQLTYCFPDCEVEIYGHPMVKQGDAFLIPKQDTHRIRSHKGELFWDFDNNEGRIPVERALESSTGRRLRCGFEEAIFLAKPNCAHYFSGITPTAGD